MKRNQIIAGSIITAVAAGATAFFFWRKSRGEAIVEIENEAQDYNREMHEKHQPKKHRTNVFHNAKAAMNGTQAVPA